MQKTEQYFGFKNSIVFKVFDHPLYYSGIFTYPFVGPKIPAGVKVRARARFCHSAQGVDQIHTRMNGFLPGAYLADGLPFSFRFRTATHLHPLSQPSPFILEVRPNAFLKVEKSPLELRLAR